MPPPLQIPPSRARRQFAARLAQRKAELEASNKEEGEGDEDEDDVAEGSASGVGGGDPASDVGGIGGQRGLSKKEGEGNAERFSGLFEGIESDSDEEEEGGDYGEEQGGDYGEGEGSGGEKEKGEVKVEV